MATSSDEKKPHVIFIPFPAQSHIKSMLKLAQLLHHKGLQITFVNTEENHNRLLKSWGHDDEQFLQDGFRFETINPDTFHGGPKDEVESAQLLLSIENNFLTPFVDFANNLVTPPTCIISDGYMSAFTIDAGQMLRIPVMLFYTVSACGFMSTYQMQSLIEKGLTPLKDESYLTNGFLDTIVNWIPGMNEVRLKDLSSSVWTTNPNDKTLTFTKNAGQSSHKVSHNIIHTFDELEPSLVDVLKSMFPNVYTIGPLQLLLDQIPEKDSQTAMSKFNGYSLWEEEPECFEWLQSKEPNSVIYVNYGSLAVMSSEELIEFGWGLAESNHYFLWIIRPDLVVGESAVFPPEFEEHIKERGFIGSWCSQEKVLNHPSVGGFLTHCGWGSTIESLSAGVPMICWPFLWDQLINSRYIWKEWEVGLELGKEVKREEVKERVQELMGEQGNRLREKAMEWKEKAHLATGLNGSSTLNVDSLVTEIITLSKTLPSQ